MVGDKPEIHVCVANNVLKLDFFQANAGILDRQTAIRVVFPDQLLQNHS